MINFGLILTYLLIGVAIIACVASPILQIKNNKKKTTKMIMPIMALVLILFLSFLIASNEVLPNYTDSNGALISANLSKIVGGALISFYLLSLFAIGSVLYSEFVYKIFKNGKK